VCLHGLLESITDVDIDDVATLFSGMVMTALLVDTNSAINCIHQACPIVSINEYPGEECVWLCVTCMNTGMLMLSGKDRRGGQEGCELAISLCEHFHGDDEQGYESQIRDGYSAILKGIK